jgi:hypothetical protein
MRRGAERATAACDAGLPVNTDLYIIPGVRRHRSRGALQRGPFRRPPACLAGPFISTAQNLPVSTFGEFTLIYMAASSVDAGGVTSKAISADRGIAGSRAGHTG